MPAADQLKIWSNDLERDAVRLVAFQRWLAIELGERLIWPRDQEKARRQIGQVSTFVEHAVADLGRHGFLFQPAELQAHIIAQLDHIATYQRKGAVSDLYAYLKAAWSGWVGRHAEKLAEQAREQRVHRSNIAPRRAPSIPEIVLRDLEAKHEEIKSKRRFRAEVQRARKTPCNASADLLLPGF
jgi:hypothetical protein